jgi:NADPH:quinone reductase-like Zn-dependent oxidoreductase
MKAIIYTEHGPPDVLKLTNVPTPEPKEHEVLVRVAAAGVNPLDWHMMRGEPYFLRLMERGTHRIPGVDVAGRVQKVGPNVTTFRAGDEVFGTARGAFAEYVCGTEKSLVLKPTALTYEQAASIPIAACTALQALRDHGRVQGGQKVLINGAAGGVGSFAVQIARALGAEVTGVCSTRNVDFIRSLGAHHVVDYTVEDFTRNGRRYDVIVNVAGNRTLRDVRRALAPHGTFVAVGQGTGRQETDAGVFGALVLIKDVLGLLALWIAPFVRQRFRMFVAKVNNRDLLFLTPLIEAGKITPIIDRAYPLPDTAEAMRYMEAGHARGKVVITVPI